MPNDAIVNVAWTAYRNWAATSRFLKAELDRWRRRTLALAIAGAVLAAFGAQIVPYARAETIWFDIAKIPAVLGSISIALAAYFGREALGGNKVTDWIKARSAAESLKAAVFLFRSTTPPFNDRNYADKLFERIGDIEETVASIPVRSSTIAELIPPLSRLTVEEYIVQRVDDQIKFYDSSAAKYQKKNEALRHATFWLGAFSIAAGVVSVGIRLSAWVGVVATLTVALAAYGEAQRYLTLTVTYQATSRRLTLLKGRWAATGKTDADTTERNSFIQSCEETLALENSAWVTQWSEGQAEARVK